MDLTEKVKTTLQETKAELKGYPRRHFMAQIVESMFDGRVSHAEQELGWNRKTLSKAMDELRGHFCYVDRTHLRGRKRAEVHLPHLLSDLKEIVDGQSQTDPTFRTNRLYTRLSAAAIRQQLIEQKGYRDEQLPTCATISTKLNEMG